LDTIYTSTLITRDKSQHCFAFSGNGEVLVAESEGDFGIEEWDEIAREAEEICREEREGLRIAVGK
jgi:hypothetical protein